MSSVASCRVHVARLFLVFCSATIHVASAASDLTELKQHFLQPPTDARPIMRWWWFGSAVTKPELERELQVMKDAGIGGVEIQPVYPLVLDDPSRELSNLPYLSDGFLDAVHFASEKARSLDMRVSITLGSGWPYGGPKTPVTEAAGHLRVDRILVRSGDHSVPMPSLTEGETLIATFISRGDARRTDPATTQRITTTAGPRLQLPSGTPNVSQVLFFIASRTGQTVKRAAIGAEGFVIDHYDSAAINRHLQTVAEPLIKAFGDHPPYSVFSDSLEVFSTDWTANLPEEFKRRRGYDLIPLLPALTGDFGDSTAAIRHDWGLTLTELAEEHYLTPLRDWAHTHHTLFRSQTYGEPPVMLSSNAIPDLAEGEGWSWRHFSNTRWASSANHLYGRPVTSSETWTWLHSPSFAATPLDLKAEADLHFLQGINQIVGHGWPYSPAQAGEPGWRFYAAAALNEHNPWFSVMPSLMLHLQRISWVLRQGSPANDIAIYIPTDDALSRFTNGKASVDRQLDSLIGPDLIGRILNAGYNFDFIDDRALANLDKLSYKVILLPGVERIPLQTLSLLQAWVNKSGAVVATRRLPSLSPGYQDSKAQTEAVKNSVHTLLESSNPRARFISDERLLIPALAAIIPPDLYVTPASSGTSALPITGFGFIHRHLPSADIYYVVNTTNKPLVARANFRIKGVNAELWDSMDGHITPVRMQASPSSTAADLDLQPYESQLLVFTPGTSNPPAPATPKSSPEAPTLESRDLEPSWNVTFAGLQNNLHFDQLHSWTDDDATRFYSGTATYTQTLQLDSAFLAPGRLVHIDFGPGTPLDSSLLRSPGMRALLDSPVRDSASISINGQHAGFVWHPPYKLDVTKLLRIGSNKIKIDVSNTAINALAGRSAPSYRLLNLRYGERFTPQDMDNLKPLPSGILGTVRLIAEHPLNESTQ